MIFEFESNSSIQKPAIEAAFKQIVEVNNPDYNRCLSYCIIDQQECYLDNSINKPDADLSTCDFFFRDCKRDCAIVNGVNITKIRSIIERKNRNSNSFTIHIN